MTDYRPSTYLCVRPAALGQTLESEGRVVSHVDDSFGVDIVVVVTWLLPLSRLRPMAT